MKTLLDATTVPMDKQQSEYMAIMSLAEMESKDKRMLDELVSKGHFPLCVLEKRLASFGDKDADITPAVRIFCGIISNSPAKAVMWAFVLHLLWRRSKKRVDFTAFVNAFPWGLPKEDEIIPIWDSQKRIPAPETFNDNLLDDKQTWDTAV